MKVLSNPIVHGALLGWATAAKIDYDAFKRWQNWHDAAEYGWGVATWRWVKGAAIGAVGSAGLGLLS